MTWSRLPLGIAALGVIGCAIGLVLAPGEMARAWLVATTTLMGLPLGAMVLLMLFVLTGGRWGAAARPALTAMAMTLPATLLLFLPLLGAIPALLPFLAASPDTLPERVVGKLAYLAPGWIVLRTLVVFALWLVSALLLRLTPWRTRITEKTGAVLGFALYALALTVFTTDWMQALEPEFSSTIYAMMVAGTQILGALAAGVVMLRVTGQLASPSGEPEAPLGDDLGRLLISGILGFVYLAYMQWLIIWIGDLPPEAAWYLARDAWPWPVAFWLMALAYAVVPFLALLLGSVRRDPKRLAAVATVMLVGYAAEAIWRVAPAFAANGTYLLLLAAAFAATGGLFVMTIDRQWRHGFVGAEARHVR